MKMRPKKMFFLGLLIAVLALGVYQILRSKQSRENARRLLALRDVCSCLWVQDEAEEFCTSLAGVDPSKINIDSVARAVSHVGQQSRWVSQREGCAEAR
jgi:hypothetical protein